MILAVLAVLTTIATIVATDAVMTKNAICLAPRHAHQPNQPSRELELPDGTFVDTLNDAVDAPAIIDYWAPFDWSPIVAIERSNSGLAWFKHANGSYSTTQMVMRSDLGRMTAMTRVVHRGAGPAGTAPEDQRTSYSSTELRDYQSRGCGR